MANAGGSAEEAAGRELAALAELRRAAIRRAFVRLDPLALGCGVGAVAGLAVLAATLLLSMRGALAVDPAGACVAGACAFATGFVAGFATAAFRNLALAIVLAWARVASDRWRRGHLLDEI
jgi:hypothetical protein